MTLKKSLFLIGIVLLLDQCSKFYIKLNFPLSVYSSDAIVDWGWFRLIFIENKGMAWGTRFSDFIPFISDDTGKLLLSLIRIAAVSVIGYMLWDAIKKQQHKLLLISGCLIFAGALGNIIDSLFYGLLFSNSYGQVASLFPEGGGYAPLFFGHVVDMLQFPMFTWVWPSWMPWIGGNPLLFLNQFSTLPIQPSALGLGLFLSSISVFFQKIKTL